MEKKLRDPFDISDVGVAKRIDPPFPKTLTDIALEDGSFGMGNIPDYVTEFLARPCPEGASITDWLNEGFELVCGKNPQSP